MISSLKLNTCDMVTKITVDLPHVSDSQNMLVKVIFLVT